MSKKAPKYEALAEVDSLEIMRKTNAWMGVIELNDGGVCLVNPVMGLQELTPNQSAVSHLLAPNHYHNKALRAFSDQNHAAQLCSTDAARPRLEKITGLKFNSLESLTKRLPVGITLVEPQGLKTGEIWLRFPVGKQTGWFVIDAFCGSKMTSTNHECQSPELLKTFPSYGVENHDQYKNWVLEQIEQDQPTLIIPCHGSIVRNSKLSIKLEQLISQL